MHTKKAKVGKELAEALATLKETILATP